MDDRWFRLGDRGRYPLSNMKYSIRSLLICLAVAAVLTNAAVFLVSVAAFESAKNRTRRSIDIRHKLWDGDPQGLSLMAELNNFNFFQRYTNAIAFVGFSEQTPKKSSLLWVDWLSYQTSSETLVVTTTDGTIYQIDLNDVVKDAGVYYHFSSTLEDLGIENCAMIRSVALQNEDGIKTDELSPTKTPFKILSLIHI